MKYISPLLLEEMESSTENRIVSLFTASQWAWINDEKFHPYKGIYPADDDIKVILEES